MDLTTYLDAVSRDLAAAAETGGPEAQAVAERLVAPLQSSLRLALLDALSAAAAEITRDLAPGSVDLRLRGREPSFVVALPAPVPGPYAAGPADADHPVTEGPADAGSVPVSPPSDAAPPDDAAMTRINLRLTEDLKGRVEDSARRSGISVNAWLVRAASSALARTEGDGGADRGRGARAAYGGERFSGWVR